MKGKQKTCIIQMNYNYKYFHSKSTFYASLLMTHNISQILKIVRPHSLQYGTALLIAKVDDHFQRPVAEWKVALVLLNESTQHDPVDQHTHIQQQHTEGNGKIVWQISDNPRVCQHPP